VTGSPGDGPERRPRSYEGSHEDLFYPPGRYTGDGSGEDLHGDDFANEFAGDDSGARHGAGDGGRGAAGSTDDGYGGWPVVADAPGPAYGRSARPARGPSGRASRRRSHPILTGLAVLVVLAVVFIGGGLFWVQRQIDPGGRRGPLVSVEIPTGASTKEIGQKLASAGVVHNATIFAFYVRLHGDGPLYPGKYLMDRNSPYSAAISSLEAGPKVLTESLVIPEGYTLRQIAAAVGALPGVGLSSAKFLAAAQGGTVRSPYEPAGSDNLEGLLFPASYQVRQGETEVEILEEMVGTFDERMTALGLQAAAARLGVTPYQVITVASIVEREAKLAGDRPDVASTIYNRLKVGMPLGADSTQTYYLRLTDPTLQPTVAQLDQPGPYNTRTNSGLPPTPIANPGLASLEAAAMPPSTQYLYFVETNPDGQLGFATDEAGFEALQRQCQAAGLC
jgi:UPF0755 protein